MNDTQVLFGLYMHPCSAWTDVEWKEEELLANLAWGRMGGWMELVLGEKKKKKKKVVDRFIYMPRKKWCTGQGAIGDVRAGHSVCMGLSVGPSLWLNWCFNALAADSIMAEEVASSFSAMSGSKYMLSKDVVCPAEKHCCCTLALSLALSPPDQCGTSQLYLKINK